MMKKHWNKKGFTLAEVMIVVAIIIVLASVGIVALSSHMRSMQQLEMDGQAKEIFVAAQNHLAMLDSQGYLGMSADSGQFGTASTLAQDANKGIYYYVVNGAGSFTNDSVLKQMLPSASMDESTRTGGSYIIRYQKDPAQILDVFYVDPNAKHGYNYTFKSTDFATLYAVSDGKSYATDKSLRRNCDDKLKKGAVIGYYGGVEQADLVKGKKLAAPTVEIVNAEVLKVKVTDNSETQSGNAIALLVRGDLSGAEKTYNFSDSQQNEQKSVILDDLTASANQFKKLGAFIPGENLTVVATSYNNSVITNVVQSAPQTTNSLFGDPSTFTDTSGTVVISNIRHLINLETDVSGVGENVISPSGKTSVTVTKATQTNDLDWTKFQTNLKNETGREMDTYPPVTPVSTLTEYDGGSHKISKISVSCATNAGLFKELSSCDVKSLELVDFSIETSAGNAGALAGVATGSDITSVLVHNSLIGGAGAAGATETVSTATAGADAALKIKGSLSVGGLVGQMGGSNAKVETSAAAVYVHSTGGAAGGLIGALAADSSVTVDSSYAGGHTEEAKFARLVPEEGTSPLTSINVLSDTSHAGGLVGDAGSSTLTLQYSYSTASAASGTTEMGETKTVGVGGLVGNVSGTLTATSCYSVGLVDGKTNASKTAYASISPLVGLGSLSNSSTGVQYLASASPLAAAPSGFSFVSAVTSGDADKFMIPATKKTAVSYDLSLALK